MFSFLTKSLVLLLVCGEGRHSRYAAENFSVTDRKA